MPIPIKYKTGTVVEIFDHAQTRTSYKTSDVHLAVLNWECNRVSKFVYSVFSLIKLS